MHRKKFRIYGLLTGVFWAFFAFLLCRNTENYELIGPPPPLYSVVLSWVLIAVNTVPVVVSFLVFRNVLYEMFLEYTPLLYMLSLLSIVVFWYYIGILVEKWAIIRSLRVLRLVFFLMILSWLVLSLIPALMGLPNGPYFMFGELCKFQESLSPLEQEAIKSGWFR